MNPALVPAVIVGGTVVSYVAAMLIGIPALVPFLNAAAAFPLMIASLRRGRVAEAIWRMLIWAAALAVCGTTISYLATAEAGRLFLRGESYRREMFEFLLSGYGPEGNIRLFLPQHLAHAAVFCALALTTGALLALPLGAMLMNYMSYYVGALGASSAHPWRAMALAWVPWAVIRVAGFVTLGVVLGGPVLSRLLRFEYRLRSQIRWIVWAALALLADVLLKWALAPSWREMIRNAAGW